MRNFVLVTAVVSKQNQHPTTASGVKNLKRGTSLAEYIENYFSQFDSAEVQALERLTRGNTETLISRKDGSVSTWNFTEYKEEDLLSALSHLTKDELRRDVKELKLGKSFEV